MFLVFQIDRGNLIMMFTNITSLTRKSMWWKTLILFLQMFNLRIKKLYCMCLKTMKQWSRWLSKEGVPQWNMFSRTHRVALDWLFDRINLGSKIQIKYIDTKNQLSDILTKGSFTRDEWNDLLCLFYISHFSSTDCSEVMSKRTKKDSGEKRVAAKSRPWIWSRDAAKGLMTCWLPLHQKARGKLDMEVNYFMSSWNEQHQRTGRQGDSLRTLATQNGILTKTWSSQEWNLRNWWKIERWDPLFAHSERINSFLKTMRQNQNCR